MKRRRVGIAILSLLILAGSCTKNQQLPEEQLSTITLNMVAGNELIGQNPVSGNPDAVNGVFSWTAGFASVKEVHLSTKGAFNLNFTSAAPVHFDMFSAWHQLGSFQVPQGTYDSMEFRIVFAPGQGNEALDLSGTFSKNGQTLPINLLINETLDLRFVKNTPTVVNADADINAAAALALSWLADNVEADQLFNAPRENGVLVISKTSNQELYDFLWKMLNDGVLTVILD